MEHIHNFTLQNQNCMKIPPPPKVCPSLGMCTEVATVTIQTYLGEFCETREQHNNMNTMLVFKRRKTFQHKVGLRIGLNWRGTICFNYRISSKEFSTTAVCSPQARWKYLESPV